MARTVRVLILEDSEDDTLLLVRELIRCEFDPKYRRVETPETMSSALDQEPWDLILADYVMPRFDALAGLHILEEKGLDIPYIVVSGNIGEETAVAAMRAGADDYLMKDNLRRLGAAVERELHAAELRRRHRQAEAVLQENEERFRTALTNSRIAIALVDAELRYTWACNYPPGPNSGPGQALPPENRDTTGFRGENGSVPIFGKRDDELSDCEGAQQLTAFKQEVLATGRGGRRTITFTLPADTRVGDIMVEPVRDAGGKVVGLTMVWIDVTPEGKRKKPQMNTDEHR
jgi:CheY-like chemotaxis protein